MLCACAGSGPSPSGQPDSPQLREPIEQIPVDLDLVARIDLGRMRSALPPGAVDRLVGLVTAEQAATVGPVGVSARKNEHTLARDTSFVFSPHLGQCPRS